jgi:sugar transferase (PEP-CTERM/EpsH1 system associated)
MKEEVKNTNTRLQPKIYRPLIAHVIHRLDVGGLENGVVNLINHMPEERYRHAVICLKDYTNFRFRLRRNDVQLFSLNKPEGKSLIVYFRLWWLLKKLKPDIVHTRNFAAIECQLPAFLAGVPGRVHSEHGWDMADVDQFDVKRRLIRRLYSIFVKQYVAVSHHIASYMAEHIKVPGPKLMQIYNGVDTNRFRPPEEGREKLPNGDFAPEGTFVIGTVGRMHTVKDQLTLVHAFLRLLNLAPHNRKNLRLVIIGEGPLRKKSLETLRKAGAANLVWMPGARDDIPRIMRGFDVFVLPSKAEGVSNTILEAMASGLPVIATCVGGNSELVIDGKTGMIVPPGDPDKMAERIRDYVEKPGLLSIHGQAGSVRANEEFSLKRMVAAYAKVYEAALAHKADFTVVKN